MQQASVLPAANLTPEYRAVDSASPTCRACVSFQTYRRKLDTINQIFQSRRLSRRRTLRCCQHGGICYEGHPVTVILKSGICHFNKWQIPLFNSTVTSWSGEFTSTAPVVGSPREAVPDPTSEWARFRWRPITGLRSRSNSRRFTLRVCGQENTFVEIWCRYSISD